MKNLLNLLFVIVLFACGKDECNDDTFIGTWVGTESCLGIGTDVTITIEKNGNNLALNGGVFNGFSVKRNDCGFEGGVALLEKASGRLSSDKKTLTLEQKVVTITNCTYVLKKQ